MSIVTVSGLIVLSIGGEMRPFAPGDAPPAAWPTAGDKPGGLLIMRADDAAPLLVLDDLYPAIVHICLRPVADILAGRPAEGPAFNHAGGWRYTPYAEDRVVVTPIGGIYALGDLFPAPQGALIIAPRRTVAEALVACARQLIDYLAGEPAAAVRPSTVAWWRAALAAAEAALTDAAPVVLAPANGASGN